MLKDDIEGIIARIEAGKPFESMVGADSFYLKIEDFVPFICVAIHNGHNFRNSLESYCLLGERERWYEEDPLTGNFIRSMPVVFISNDSRYEYDLNRPVEECIYQEAWGKRIWKSELPKDEKEISYQKHVDFYRILDALLIRIEKQFGACIVYDIHSYNYKRYDREVPLFNIGTEKISKKKYGKYIRNWIKELSGIRLSQIQTEVAENDVFYGRGFLLEHVTREFSNTLVLATEIKKVYCNENSGEVYPLVVSELETSLKKAILNNAFTFLQSRTKLKIVKKHGLLSRELDPSILNIDRKLYQLVHTFEVLNYVNPVNIEYEKRKFFASRYMINPSFRYRQLSINPFDMKRKLYGIRVEDIKDISIQTLYKDTISAYGNKVEILANLGTHKFLYNCLRYYGEPRDSDLRDAEFFVHCPEIMDEKEELKYGSVEARRFFLEMAESYGFDFKIDISGRIASKALVINHKRKALINKFATFTESELRALMNHEIGVHAVTTMNSLMQPLKIFNIGLPLNDLTQEGLAILSEYLSGNFSLKRLKTLAKRAVAISFMLKGHDFQETFRMLMETYKMDRDSAFYLTTRTFRGGGFTKDYLYLRGFKKVLRFYNGGQNHLDNLLIGKTSLDYLDIINEMLERKMLIRPRFVTNSFNNPVEKNGTLDYLLKRLL
ncbi:MAG: flavohemoglobin expression-modulating QEGLA motif protein [Bacteroidota bacterium]